jgi:hypothetical protein
MLNKYTQGLWIFKMIFQLANDCRGELVARKFHQYQRPSARTMQDSVLCQWSECRGNITVNRKVPAN